MLTENQVNRVWNKMVEAEVRSLYFADLAGRYNRYKQILTGVSFFLSSGAAATLLAKAPDWIPILLAIIVAILSAYLTVIGFFYAAVCLNREYTCSPHFSISFSS